MLNVFPFFATNLHASSLFASNSFSFPGLIISRRVLPAASSLEEEDVVDGATDFCPKGGGGSEGGATSEFELIFKFPKDGPPELPRSRLN